jgi:hypothetical protein
VTAADEETAADQRGFGSEPAIDGDDTLVISRSAVNGPDQHDADGTFPPVVIPQLDQQRQRLGVPQGVARSTC